MLYLFGFLLSQGTKGIFLQVRTSELYFYSLQTGGISAPCFSLLYIDTMLSPAFAYTGLPTYHQAIYGDSYSSMFVSAGYIHLHTAKYPLP